MSGEVKIIEKEKIEFGKQTAIVGFPDIGLVGTIAIYHMIEEMKMKEIAYMESDEFPPVAVIHDGRPLSPIRIYGNRKLLMVISEIPVTYSILHSISRKLVEWFKSKKVDLIVSLGGIPHPGRLDIENPAVYGMGVNKETDKILKENDVERLEEGLIVGPYAIILLESIKNKMNAVYLMAESHAKYPDPEASAMVIKLLNRILGLDVDVKKLIETGGEIKIKSRDLMKRTENALEEMQKSQEQEIPMMYR